MLKFVGELRDEATQEIEAPSTLLKTKYLPSLADSTYEALPTGVKLQLKRARLDFRILLRESDDAVKYELFDRLNSGGMETSPQEVRTALVIMKDPTLHEWLQSLRSLETIRGTLALTDRQRDEQYDLELLVRYLVFGRSSAEELAAFADIDSFLTEQILDCASDPAFDRDALAAQTIDLFSVIWAMGPDAFRRYDETKKKSLGAFSVSAFEAVTAGVTHHLGAWLQLDPHDREELLIKRVQTLWSDGDFRKYSGGGVRASTRAPRMPQVGARIFDPA